MRSAVTDILPLSVRRSLSSLGTGLALARRKRSLTVAMMAERIGVSKSTYLRAEKGDPTTAMAVYAMALYVLGLGEPLKDLADPGQDEQGLLLDEERLPRRVRPKRALRPT
jgi:DNA-binding XRE family transcriptional regulator